MTSPGKPAASEKARAAVPRDIRTLKAGAARAVKKGQLAQAAALLKRALSAAPEDAELHLRLGTCLADMGRNRLAESHLDQARRRAPDLPGAHIALGKLLARRRRHPEAAECFRAAVALAPRRPKLWQRLGMMLRRTGDLEGAAGAQIEALRLDGSLANAHYELGLVHMTQGNAEQASESLQRAVALDPGSVYIRATAASAEAELAAAGQPGDRTTAKRVALHMNDDFQYSILRPIFDALKGRHHVRLTSEPQLVAGFRPQVVVVADAQGARLRKVAPDAVFVYTRHGLITKNHAFKAAGLCDYLSGVSSPAIRDLAVRHGGFAPERVWVTGYVQMDPLFRGDPLPLPFELPPGRKTVLFAPTYNARLSAAPLLRGRVAQLIGGRRNDVNIILKPHPRTYEMNRGMVTRWRGIARRNDRVFLVEDESADAMAFLRAADVLVSDACSLPFAYLALDRPIILITHPRHREDPGYDPDGIEWRWRDLGEELFDVEELPAAVERALADPGRHADRRAHYRRLLFGDLTDGRAAERIAGHITALPQ